MIDKEEKRRQRTEYMRKWRDNLPPDKKEKYRNYYKERARERYRKLTVEERLAFIEKQKRYYHEHYKQVLRERTLKKLGK